MANRINPLISIVRKYDMISKSNWALARGIPSKHFFDIDKGTHAPESILGITSPYIEKIKELKTKEPKIDRLVFIEKAFGIMCRNDTEISTPAAKQMKYMVFLRPQRSKRRMT